MRDDRAVPDPFRFLEDETDAATRTWLRARRVEVEAALAGPDRLRFELSTRLHALSSRPALSLPRVGGRCEFSWRSFEDGRPDVLVVRDRGSGGERILLDPGRLEDGAIAVRGIFPSPDGTRLAYRACARNADDATIVVVDVATARNVLVAPGARFGFPSWRADSRGFFATLSGETGVVADRDLARARPSFVDLGDGTVRSLRGTAEESGWHGQPRCSEDGAVLLLEERRGPHLARLRFAFLRDPSLEWRTLLAEGTPAEDLVWWAGSFWARSTTGSPNGRIDRIGIDGVRSTILPEREVPLRHHTVVGGQIAVTESGEGGTGILLVDPGATGAACRRVRLPRYASTPGVQGSAGSTTAYVALSTPSRSHCVYQLDVRTTRLQRWRRAPPPASTPAITVERVGFASADGVSIPAYFLCPRPSRPTALPVLVAGYGGFGLSVVPEFVPLHAAWIERGGAVLLPGLRGGGERGLAWHRAGQGRNKQRSIDDLIAAARWLVTSGRSVRGRIAVMGHSNGAMVAASATLQEPEWWGAAILVAPLADMARFHIGGLGKTWIGEYGSPEDPQRLAGLLELSPYHLAQRPGRSPPTLILDNASDDRVPPWHGRKLAAALAARGPGAVFLRSRPLGHAGPFTVAQQVEEDTDILLFLHQHLGVR